MPSTLAAAWRLPSERSSARCMYARLDLSHDVAQAHPIGELLIQVDDRDLAIDVQQQVLGA